MGNKYTDDDYCDIYENKICDNCGKCLEQEGIDIRAIRIEDIAKTVEENKLLEEEYMNNLKSMKNTETIDNDLEEENTDEGVFEARLDIDESKRLADAYKQFEKEHNLSLDDEEYKDAFDHIEYLDEDIFSDGTLEDMTEEIFPGVRKMKKK